MQKILGRDKQKNINTGQKQFSFPKKDKDPNAMDVDRISTEERTKLMKEGKCFKCQNFGHLAKDCPNEQRTQNTPQKKWTEKDAATHVRALIAQMDNDQKRKFQENAKSEGLGF